MELKKRNRVSVMITVMAFLVMGVLFASYKPASAANRDEAQRLVERAQITFEDFMHDSNYSWLQKNLEGAKGVLIFPEVLKGGFIWGGSGGTGVLLVRNEGRGQWSQPAFYTMGSVTFGLQIGGEASEVLVLAMTQKAVDSLLSSSFKLGGDTSVAVGPVGAGAKANADLPSVTADFLTFTKAKGLYGGLNLEGAVIAVRDSLNEAYYGRAVRPVDIVERHMVANRGSAGLRESLKCKC
jgi:lipid-binding SYLF domain-containing protein